MLQINRSPERDGYTFSLHPLSKKELVAQNSRATPYPRIFIAIDTSSEFEAVRGNLYLQIAELLTNLSEEELLTQGGFTVVDPVTEKQLYSTAND